MSEANNSMNFEKRTICGVYKIDVSKVHNINHKGLAKNIILGRQKTEPSRKNGWTAEDCKIIMVYMVQKYSSTVRILTERKE